MSSPAARPDPRHLLHLDRRTIFPAPPDVVWDYMSRTERFPVWWRWLREFDDRGQGLTSGGALSGLVVPPIPYHFRVTIHLDEVVPARLIRATLGEDLHGPAALSLHEIPQGTELRIRWDVEMRKPAMRAAARFARPVLVWGHDQVIDITLHRFERVVHDGE